MPKTINPIKKAIVKNRLMQGYSAKESLLQAKYSSNTAKRSTANKAVKISQEEILKDFELSRITPEYVLKNVNDIMNDKEANHSDKLRASELLGKFLKMWTERTEIDNKNPEKIVISYVKDTNVKEYTKVSSYTKQDNITQPIDTNRDSSNNSS